jgi:hypothetical protein
VVFKKAILISGKKKQQKPKDQNMPGISSNMPCQYYFEIIFFTVGISSWSVKNNDIPLESGIR